MWGRRDSADFAAHDVRLAAASRARWPELAAAAVLTLVALLLWNMVLHHDVVWQLWIGRQILHGANLYTDIMEINPPLWFWVAVPLNAMAEATGIAAGKLLTLFFLGSIALAIALSAMLIRDMEARDRALLYASILVVTILMLLPDFGQREHYVLIASIPYVVLIARRAEGKAASTVVAVTVGLFAALGFGLKHYFVLAPVFLEIWLFHSRRVSPLRPEVIALCGAGFAYGASILLFSPEYLTDMVPMIRAAYESYEVPLLEQFSQPVIPIYLLAIVAFGLYGKPSSQLSRAAFIGSAAFLVAYFLQRKGWRYHALPASGLMLLAIVAELLGARMDTFRKKATIPLFGMALAIPAIMAGLWGTYDNTSRLAIEAALRDVPRGEAVMSISANPSHVWPMVEEMGLVWPSRYMAFWMLPTIAARKSPELFMLADRIRRDTVHDIACTSPKMIIVSNTSGSSWRYHRDFDVLGFFRENQQFNEIFSHYRKGISYRSIPILNSRRRPKEFARFDTYVLSATIPRPARCRQIH